MIQHLFTYPTVTPNCRDDKGWTPLHSACCYSTNYDLINFLIDKLANVTEATMDGTRAVDYFVRHQPKQEKLPQYVEILDCLLEGTGVDYKNLQSGETCLHAALKAPSKNLQVIHELIQRNGDPNIVNDVGETALHYAVKCQRVDVVEYFLTVSSIDISVKSEEGQKRTAYDEANALGSSEINNLIIEMLRQHNKLDGASEQETEVILKEKLAEMEEKTKKVDELSKQLEDELVYLQKQYNELLEEEKQALKELEVLKQKHFSVNHLKFC